MKLKKFILDQRAKQFFKERMLLEDNIGQKIFNNINYNSGKLYTYLPPKTSEKALYGFSTGGKFEVDQSQVVVREGWRYVPVSQIGINYFFYELKKMLSQNEDNICLLRSGWWDKKEMLDFKIKTPLHFYKNYGYIFFSPKMSLEEIISGFAEVAEASPLKLGFITKRSPSMKFLEKHESNISSKELNLMIKNISLLFTVAYDHEGYIIWEL